MLSVTFKLFLKFPLDPARQLFKFDGLLAFDGSLFDDGEEEARPTDLEESLCGVVGQAANRLDKLLASRRGGIGLWRLVIDFAT